MNQIYFTTTGMVFDPYDKVSLERLEKKNSVYDTRTHSFTPVGGFMINDNGGDKYVTYKIPYDVLEKEYPLYSINDEIDKPYKGEYINSFSLNSDITLSDIQFDTINDVIKKKYNSAFLNIPSGIGKTLLSVQLIATLGRKALVLCYSSQVLNQWKKTFNTMTNIDTNRVTVLTSSKVLYDASIGEYDSSDKDVYLCTPKLLHSFCERYGYSNLQSAMVGLGVGVKIIDEAHKNLGNIVRINGFTNIAKTFYLSGDYDQGNKQRRIIFYNIFKNVPVIKLSGKTLEKLKYLNCVVVKYDSQPNPKERLSVLLKGKVFDNYRYMRYQMKHKDTYNILLCLMDTIDKKSSGNDEKILILLNLIKHVDIMFDKLNKEYGNKYTIGRFHSKLGKEEREETLKNANLIISTHQSFEVGVDVKNIRFVINMTSSNYVEDNQAASRARPRADGQDCFYFIFADVGFPFIAERLPERLNYLYKYKVKNIFNISY